MSPSEPSTHLGKQASEILNEGTDWVTLGNQLDVTRLKHLDGYPEWHPSSPFRPMFLAYLWAKVEDESLSGIPERLEEQPELAEAFGFDPDNLPSESTCKPCRLDDRFDDLQRTVKNTEKHIRKVAAKRGSPIGHRIRGAVSHTEQNPSPSKRTTDRLLRKTGRKVLKEIDSVVIPSIQLPRPENTIYDDDELLVQEAIGAINHEAANQAGESLGDKKNPDPDIKEPFSHEGPEDGDPFYADGPTGETLLESVKEMSVEEIATQLNFALRKTYTRAKPRLRDLENDNGSRFGTRAKIALDITYVAYYGEREEMVWLQGAPDDKEYRWCHKFATAVIVGQNTHYVVGVCPLGSTEYANTDAYPGEEQSYYVGDVARRLLSIADEYVNVRMVYADREFHSTDVIHTLEERGLNYVIPAVKNDRIRRICDRFDQLKRGYNEPHDTPLYVDCGLSMYGPVKHDVSNTAVEYNLVVLPPDEDDEVHEEGSPQPFLTNLDVSDEIALDRRWATEQMEKYQDRAAIENSYSSIKEAASWTTSKEFEVRWFHFAFGCVVYNMWLLVDFLTQERIKVIETREKPRIKLSRFTNWVEKELGELL
ncbi:hypothetical protein BDK88_4199 [Natrinema hispanicum]|uniref:Transposase IS4-like domain-containing protein n=1 Tax=Natrinema hispanicum TaxID=392421 RepID=A0A482YAP1_9EURY|nr:transposase [Natrinema hispanicum]RZV05179.1 hypothetical protein BDK88_4199 [Natrinema hispanicum]